MSLLRRTRHFSDPGFLDRWIARPLLGLLNACASTGSDRTRPAAPFPLLPGTLCLIKLSGMGSFVNTLPLLKNLRERYPGSTILYLSFDSNRELARRTPEIDLFVGIKTKSLAAFLSSYVRAILTVRTFSPDLLLDLQIIKTPALTSLVARLSKARHILTFIRPSQRFREVFSVTIPVEGQAPLPELFDRMGKKAGLTRSLGPHPPFRIDPRDRQELLARKIESRPDRRILVINPNASDFCLERRWPLLFFAETAAHLLDRFRDLSIVLTGSKNERSYVDRLAWCINRGEARVRNMAGTLSIGAFLALLDLSDCFLTNDSGPMHLGFVMGTPTVALFGPADPKHHTLHAHPRRSRILYHRISCSPCVHQFASAPCRGHNLCLQSIFPSEVLAACSSLLATSKDTMPRWLAEQANGRTGEPGNVPGTDKGLRKAGKNGP